MGTAAGVNPEQDVQRAQPANGGPDEDEAEQGEVLVRRIERSIETEHENPENQPDRTVNPTDILLRPFHTSPFYSHCIRWEW